MFHVLFECTIQAKSPSLTLLFLLRRKTTLLDVIAGYKTGGRITGDLTLNGLPKDPKIWTLLAGYAEQNDLLNPYLTVMETLKFTASCRLPASMNRASVISNIIGLMSLEDWIDFVVGIENEGEGIPKHVRKRLTIAVQLVMLPKILFLDVSPNSFLPLAAVLLSKLTYLLPVF